LTPQGFHMFSQARILQSDDVLLHTGEKTEKIVK